MGNYTGKPGCPCGGWGTYICPVPEVSPARGHGPTQERPGESMARLLAAVEAASRLAGDWTRKADALEAAAAQVAAQAPGEPGAALKLGRSRGFGECAHQLAYVLRDALLPDENPGGSTEGSED
jgi:hypothetical protein